MRGCILQPGYLPWLGFFEQFIFSEVFVFLDDVKYTKQDWRNRNRIRINNKVGWIYLTVPVIKTNENTLIKDVRINYKENWIEKQKNILKAVYKKTKYFEEIYLIIKKHLNQKYVNLIDLDVNLILEICKYLKINRKILFSSNLEVKTKDKNLRLIEICKKTEIDYFYDGAAAEAFIDLKQFNKEGIKIEFQNYIHSEYKQLFEPFIPYMSIIDLLFNYGKSSLNYISHLKKNKGAI
jgi:hypothetical protein